MFHRIRKPARSPLKGLAPLAAAAAVFLLVSGSSFGADIPCIWSGIQKIVAVGDLHGDYDNFIEILKGTGLVGEDLAWAGGTIHLVQTGDILDRGTEARKILDLLIRLEKQASAAGGMVHVLLGNHEEMNIAGIALDYPNYVTVEQFVSFLPDDYRKAKEKEFLRGLPEAERNRLEKEGLSFAENGDLRAYWTRLMRRDVEARREYSDGFNGKYGDWLLRKNAVIKINDIIFAHGGVSEKYSTWKIQDLNNDLRQELDFFQGRRRHPQDIARPFRPKIVYDPDSPLWYRGLAGTDEATSNRQVGRILANLNANFMVIGHNYFRYGGGSPIVTDLTNVRSYEGRVFIIDTGISHAYGGVPTALIINDSRFSLWQPNGISSEPLTKVPAVQAAPSAPPDLEAFLKTAAISNVQKTAMPGRTEPWRVTLEAGGVSRRAVFKYIDRRRPDVLADSYQYELAAYALSKYLEFKIVPVTVEREIEDIPGSLQAFVENAITEADRKAQHLTPPDAEAFERALADVRVFSFLANAGCGNDREILISRNDWSVYRIDFAQAFAPDGGPSDGCSIQRCSRRLYAKLRAWNSEAAARLLSSRLGKDEIQGLESRRKWILRTLERLIRTSGENAVLF